MWFRYLRQFAASTEAQAFAIGAVILITIAVTGLTVYLSINAPIATKECEFQHSTEVADDFAVLNSTINWMHTVINSRILEYLDGKPEVSERRTAISSFVQGNSLIESVPIKLTPTKDSAIALPLASGAIRFLPNEGHIIVRLSETGSGNLDTWLTDNFVECPSPNCNFSHVYETGYNGDVTNASGNITLAGPPYVPAIIESNMTNITDSISFDTKSNSTVYENITWYVENLTAETSIIMKVRTDMFPDMRNATEWYKCYGIGKESEDGRNLFPLSDLYTVSNGHRYVQFRAELKTENPQKRPELINVSIDYRHENVTLAQSSGIIRFKSSYQYFPNQEITYENGAVIKSQEDGKLVYGPFKVTFQNVSNNRTRIDLSIVNLTGETVSGIAGGSTLVRLRLIDRKLVSDYFFYPNLTIAVSSSNAGVIANRLNKTLEEANLTSPHDYKYKVINITAGTVEIEFYAKGQGIKLYLEEATIGVVM